MGELCLSFRFRYAHHTSRGHATFEVSNSGQGTLQRIGWEDFVPLTEWKDFALPEERWNSLEERLEAIDWTAAALPPPASSADDAIVLVFRRRGRLIPPTLWNESVFAILPVPPTPKRKGDGNDAALVEALAELEAAIRWAWEHGQTS